MARHFPCLIACERTPPLSEPDILLVGGATASGKSAYALDWAEARGGRIVNADSMQLYVDLPILTARPSPAEEARVPHRLYGILPPDQTLSTGDWIRAVQSELVAARQAGQPVAIVGGTGLYFLSLIRGLAEIPAIPDPVREAARAQLAHDGEQAVRTLLRDKDPAAEARISPGDHQRLARALEVWLATGRALSDWQADTQPLLAPGTYARVVIAPDRERLYARCDTRFDLMLRAGALDEVEALMAQGLAPDWPILRVLGARELWGLIRGELDRDTAIDQAKTLTRQYAKRQLTFFRNQFSDWPRFDPA